ncbi:phosphate ABC transporter substrate-binding/OmpA family protein [Tropicimonas sp. IMCC34043]|uniref:phosphate ABC transporter substrate-binding/OmpA family protein n=1 Tax=Tropicimonas sp. IMCC34043 TaxID=2248760 RepID=UPI001E28C0CA|nr:phosphate ABC transporter substrate-binding/OmpA family protein [Tropicimonas sp. IMCC34043]
MIDENQSGGAVMSNAMLLSAMLAVATVLPQAAAAQQEAPVTVTSRDGGFVITGTLAGFDGQLLRLSTDYGPVTVDIAEVTCEGAACPDPSAPMVPTLRLSGAPALGAVLLPALIQTFAGRRAVSFDRADPAPDRIEIALSDAGVPVARFELTLSTTEEGFADLAADEADMVMAVREIRADEAQRSFDAGAGDLTGPRRLRVVALDALAPAVSPANPFGGASFPMLAGIWSGEIADWSALTGIEAPVAVHDLPAEGGFAQGFADRVLAPAGLAPAPTVMRHDDAAELALAVAQNPAAIGLARFSQIGNLRPVALVGDCGRRLSLSAASLKAEDYPLAAPLALYVPARRMPQIFRDFLDFLGTPAADLVVRRLGLTDQVPVEVPLADQGERLANAILAAGEEVSLGDLQQMLVELADTRRLSITFRFRGGSTRLDPMSESGVDRLARDIAAGIYDGRQILFAGFSDGDGAAAGNREIALRRAEAVLAAVREELQRLGTPPGAGPALRAEGFGEALPLACDDSDWGRQANRRVEVWLR